MIKGKHLAVVAPALSYLALRPLKGRALATTFTKMDLPKATQGDKVVAIDRVARKHLPSGWKMSYGNEIKDIDGAVKAFLPISVRKSLGKKRSRQVIRRMMSNRDWTIPGSKESHVNTLTLGSALHEVGHAQDYSRNPARASLMAVKGAEVAPILAATMAMGLVVLSKKMRNPKQFLRFIGRKPEILVAAGVAPLMYREAVATAAAMKQTKRGRKSLIPLMASYAGLSAVPVVAVNIAKRLI